MHVKILFIAENEDVFQTLDWTGRANTVRIRCFRQLSQLKYNPGSIVWVQQSLRDDQMPKHSWVQMSDHCSNYHLSWQLGGKQWTDTVKGNLPGMWPCMYSISQHIALSDDVRLLDEPTLFCCSQTCFIYMNQRILDAGWEREHGNPAHTLVCVRALLL